MSQSAAASPSTGLRLQRIVESFSEKNCCFLLTANVANDLAMWAYQLALGWLVFELTHSPLALGLVFCVRGVAFMTGALIGGAWADRFDRRNVVELVQSVMIVTVTLLGAVTMLGSIRTWHLFVGTFVVASCHGIGNPTRQSMFRDVVPPAMLANAVSTNAIGMNLSRLIGPAGGGAFFAFLGGESVFFFCALSWTIGTLSITRITKPSVPSQGAKEPFRRSLVNGIRYARRHEVIAGVLLMTVTLNAVAMSFQQILPAYVSDDLGLGAGGFGLLMSTMGAGAVLAATFITASGGRFATGIVLIGTVGISGLCLISLGAYRDVALAAPLLVIMGGCSAVALSVSMILIQTHVEDAYRGRAMSLFLVIHGLQYVFALPVGSIAQAIDTPAAYICMGVATACATVALAIGSPGLRHATTAKAPGPIGH